MQKYFNRHAHMDDETRHEILVLTNEVENWSIRNWLYGLFDGFNYANDIRKEMVGTDGDKPESPEIQGKLAKICAVIETYQVAHEDVTKH